jgi:hypothetical protein
MDADVLVRPADEAVEFSLAVKGVQALAVEVLFLYLADDADGLAARGPEALDQLIQRKPIVFPGLGKVEPVYIEIRRGARPPARMSL